MSEIDVIIDSLEKCAALDKDLTNEIYEHFFAHCAAAIELMGHSDQYMRGRMIDQVYELIMDPAQEGAGGYLHWEIDNHLNAYGVQVEMYPAFLQALKASVATALADAWTAEHEQAWDTRCANLLTDIHAHAGQRSTS